MVLSCTNQFQYNCRYVTVLLVDVKETMASTGCSHLALTTTNQPASEETSSNPYESRHIRMTTSMVIGITAKFWTTIVHSAYNHWYISILRQPVVICRYVTLLVCKMKGSKGKHFKFDGSYGMMVKDDLFRSVVKGIPLQGYSSIELLHKHVISDRYITFFNQPSSYFKYISVVL